MGRVAGSCGRRHAAGPHGRTARLVPRRSAQRRGGCRDRAGGDRRGREGGSRDGGTPRRRGRSRGDPSGGSRSGPDHSCGDPSGRHGRARGGRCGRCAWRVRRGRRSRADPAARDDLPDGPAASRGCCTPATPPVARRLGPPRAADPRGRRRRRLRDRDGPSPAHAASGRRHAHRLARPQRRRAVGDACPERGHFTGAGRVPVVSPASAAPTPTATARTYVVVRGDQLGRIAASFGVTLQALQAANGIANPNLIFVGQKLVIPPPSASPGASPSASPSAAP